MRISCANGTLGRLAQYPVIGAMRTLLSLALAISFCAAIAQTNPPAAGQATAPAKAADAPKSDFKPYAEIITKEFVSQNGVFKVHRNEDKDRILWEIPSNLLGRELLWQTEISELPQGGGYPGLGMGTRVVKFERRKNKLFMRDVRHGMRTSDKGALGDGVQATNVNPIIRAFEIQTEGDGKSAVIDVTTLFMSDPPEFQVKGAFGGGMVDSSRSFIQRVKAFPTNIETRSVLTFVGGQSAPQGRRGGGGGGGTATATIHYSLVLLPEEPMKGRLKDSRIGYFTQGFDYIPVNGAVKPIEYINRFRLEKKDPNAAVSEPVQPIVYYLAREVPEKWRPIMKKGVEAWQSAFEKAGFKNAIICKDAPTLQEDPTWDPEDARYSVIRWAPSRTANAMGPSIQDPRSGETISAHVIFWHNIIDLLQKWYFVQCAAIDPRCKKLPLSDDHIGEMLQYVVTHEVGHTLGLEHNFEASASRTIAQLRNPAFMKNRGVSSSIMSYSRNNYVAQPGDGITNSTNGFIGEYDDFAIDYGYRVIPGTRGGDTEKSALDLILSRQVNDPTVRFGNYKYNEDPTTQSERVGEDCIEATRLGLMNLDRIGQSILIPATSKFGEDYTLLGEVYGDMQQHRIMWLMHTIKEVGGVVENDVHSGRGGHVFKPVSRERQQKAVRFLANSGMETPKGMMNQEILRRLFPAGDLSQMTGVQSLIMGQLLADGRLNRLQDQEIAAGAKAYRVSDLVSDLQSGVWREVSGKSPAIPASRRVLQNSYLDTMDAKINGTSRRSDFTLIAKANLKALAKQIDAAIPRAKDAMTAGHLSESRAWINKILAGKTGRTSGASAGPSVFDLFGVKEEDVKAMEPWLESGQICFSREGMVYDFLRRMEK